PNDLILMECVLADLQNCLAEVNAVSPRVGRVLERMTKIDPRGRYASLQAILDDLAPKEGPARPRYDLFVSYRRKRGAVVARAIVERLKSEGVRAFMDVNSLDSGPYSEQLLAYIEETPNFVVILTRGSLERCEDEEDWLRREIAHAITKQ